uniref:sensor histidine kinase n=1 Tax=uncultured Microbacterium sp. TaxID=191216 RepID=UPI0028E3DBBF
ALVLAALAALALLWRRSLDRAARSARAAADAAAQAEHRRFLARLDHELKNPITAIRAAVAATGDPEGPAAAPALRAQLRTIDTQTDRLSRLVGDLRKLAELQTIDLERARVDLGALLDDVVEAVAAAYARTVSVALPAAPWPLPAVPGDPDLLFVALYNVAANAAKYSEAEDLIEVRGSEQAGSVVLEIADTGRGIPPADQPVVFEELARGANARDRPGSGLGLALARTIVARHGGDITLVSREGQGTRVRVSLPAHESHA